MPDRRTHRGAHPEDAASFARDAWPALRRATAELCWLFDRGYAVPSSLKLVGDRHGLTRRQRIAVTRCACSRQQLERRGDSRVDPERVAGRTLHLDGYNVLTTIEAALAGGVILAGRDGCFRDMASMHGSYRKVAETLPAIRLIGETIAPWRPKECAWLLDRPVSNSGRLKGILQAIAVDAGWNWRVELVADPDAMLCETDGIVATADSAVLDRCRAWVNLARLAIETRIPQAGIVDLAPDAER